MSDKTVRYVCHRTEDAIDADGHLQEEAWAQAPRSPRFGDHTGQRSLFDTRAAMLWDDQNLYVGFWMEDRDVCAVRRKRIRCQSGRTTTRECSSSVGERITNWRSIRWARPRRCSTSGRKPISAVGATTCRSSIWRCIGPKSWAGDLIPIIAPCAGLFRTGAFPDCRLGCQVEGTLNKRDDSDRGWSVELAFPWEGLKRLADAQSLPPAASDVWRVGLVRRQIIDQRASRRQVSWTWQPLSESNMHVPETHLEVEFSRVPPGESAANSA